MSLVTPAYNEALILEKNLAILCDYMESLETEYRWELVIVNDGSRDNTGELAEAFARTRKNVKVAHHPTNFGMGQALRTGFERCEGEYIIVLDMDLSFAPEHVERLLDKIRQTHAKIVTASPYMKGGKVSNVPFFRLLLSVCANWFLSFTTKGNFTSITGMARVYDAEFLRSLNLRSKGMDINPEILHKATLLEARVVEIPAHLRWIPQTDVPRSKRRKSSMTTMKILKHTWSIGFFGFLFRPVMFFVLPSLFFFAIALYSNAWALIHCWNHYHRLVQQTSFENFDTAVSAAVAAAFQQSPHSFVIGGITLMLGIQLFGLGVLSMQNKSYFEELFYLGTSIYKSSSRK
ncbi:MAG TPA: glycosyltransferase family 2 protein [Synechococcales cyanobacterium M55_K2018_004]|nr:glycosyltransferase family 2 protein [Synechococcales cyanobacterium M55_K2018_004]